MPTPRRGSRLLRTGRVSNPGQTYLVTTTTRQRAPIFLDWQAAAAACRLTASAEVLGNHRFLAWVLMPDHFHGLLLLGDGAPLAETMRRFKGNTAHRVNRALGRSGPVWQSGFHDRAMRKDDDLVAMARYVVMNPLRAGLVRRIGEYPFWNAEWL